MNKKTIDRYQLWFNLHRISDQIAKHEANLFKELHLTKTQHGILLTIAFLLEHKNEFIKITDLIPYQNSGFVSVSLTVDRMEKKGLLKKVRDVSDRRAVSINITAKGKKLLEQVSNPTSDLVNKLFSVYSDEELIQMSSLFKKLYGTIEEEGTTGDRVHKLTLKKRIDFLIKLSSH